MMHELRIAYELLLDAKRHKQRIADVVLALQDCSRTPPAPGSSPRILGKLLLSFFIFVLCLRFYLFLSLNRLYYLMICLFIFSIPIHSTYKQTHLYNIILDLSIAYTKVIYVYKNT